MTEGTGRLMAIESKLEALDSKLDSLLYGNGKPGIITRLYRVEWALVLVAAALASPTAAEAIKGALR